MATQRICSAPDCDKPHKARGLCLLHYRRLQRASGKQPDGKHRISKRPVPEISAEETTAAIMIRLLETDQQECITWPRGRNEGGYGMASWEGKAVIVSRKVCELTWGPPPTDVPYIAAHSCGNGHLGCVNPNHIRWATSVENGAEASLHRFEEALYEIIHPGEVHPRTLTSRKPPKQKLIPANAAYQPATNMTAEDARLTLEHLRRTLSPKTGTKFYAQSD